MHFTEEEIKELSLIYLNKYYEENNLKNVKDFVNTYAGIKDLICSLDKNNEIKTLSQKVL